MTLTVINLQKIIPIHSQKIKRILKNILAVEKFRKTSVSVVFVGAQKIHALNVQFLKHNYPTDVLTFDLKDEAEIVISTDAARQNARRFKTSVEHEMILYLIHGIFHLKGYDDHSVTGIKKMRAREEEILGLFNVSST